MGAFESYVLEYLSIAIVFISVIFLVIVARKLLDMVVDFLRYMEILKKPQPLTGGELRRDVAEIKRTTYKISKDWKDMINLMSSFRDQQISDNNTVKDDIKSMNESLHDSMSWFQEEESDKNDQKHMEMKKMMSLLMDEMNSVKEITRSNGDTVLKTIQEYRPLKMNTVHMWAQTEREMAVKNKIQETLEDKSVERSSSKLTLRRIVRELQSEIRLTAAKEREELMNQLEVILTQINNDQEVIKNAIQQVLAATSFQNQLCFEKFGVAGQEVVKHVSEKSITHLKDKFEEFGKKLGDIFDSMKTTSFEVSSIRVTLDSIDSQMDEIFQKIELGSEKNVEQCELVLGELEAATSVWKNSSMQLTDMAQRLSDLNYGVEHLMNELKERSCETKDLVLFGYESVAISVSDAADQRMSGHYTNLECFLKLQMLVQSCSENVTSLQDRIENSSNDVKMATENLLRQIRCTCNLIASVGERFCHFNSPDFEVIDSGSRFRRDVNVRAASGEVATQTSSLIMPDTRVMGDSCLKSPKKIKSPSKIKAPGSPVKRGKTIYSDSGSNKVQSKMPERKKNSVEKKRKN